jgi:CheY-like chemotaxis protein
LTANGSILGVSEQLQSWRVDGDYYVHRTALVVNGDKPAQDLQQFLVDAGYDVLATKDNDEALALCHNHQRAIHLFVTDAELPGTSGWELAERATALRPGIVILYLSRGSPSSGTGQFLGPKSHVPGTDAFRKANILRDVTQALIHKKQQNIQ